MNRELLFAEESPRAELARLHRFGIEGLCCQPVQFIQGLAGVEI